MTPSTLAILTELLSALEWLARDGADPDDCAKARPHLEKAREMIDAEVKAGKVNDDQWTSSTRLR